MNPSSPHDAPVMLGTSHSVTGGPPSEETFLIAPPVEKPIQRPSGEKNGADPPAVPGNGSSWKRGGYLARWHASSLSCRAGEPRHRKERGLISASNRSI